MKILIILTTLLFSIFAGIELKKHKTSDFLKLTRIGTLNIAIDAIEMDKKACLEAAVSIHDDKEIIGMSVRGIAKEIYAHIAVHNIIEKLPSAIKNLTFVRRINNSTINGIDLEDYGDTFLRRIAYNIIWAAAL